MLPLKKHVQDALRIRARVMAQEDKRKAAFGRSTWTPLVQLDAPMFASHTPSKQAPSSNNSHTSQTSRSSQPQAPVSNTSQQRERNGRKLPPPMPSSTSSSTGRPGVQLFDPRAMKTRRNNASQNSGGAGLRRRGGNESNQIPPPPTSQGSIPAYMTPGGGVSLQMNYNQHARNRTEDALNLEKRIVEIGETFHRVANIVADQQATVEHIAKDID